MGYNETLTRMKRKRYRVDRIWSLYNIIFSNRTSFNYIYVHKIEYL